MLLKLVVTLLCTTTVFCDFIHIRQHVKAPTPHHVHKIHPKNHKRGTFSAIPPFKAGYDIPVVTHSFIKPLIVQYPTKTVPIGVKIPLKHPLEDKHPLPVGHDLPAPLPGPNIKIPGWTKPLLVPLPSVHQIVRPVVPTVPVVPAPQPVVPVAPTIPVSPSIQHPVPIPPPPVPTVPVNFRPVLPVNPVVIQQPPLIPVQPPPAALIPVQPPPPHLVPVRPAVIPVHSAPPPLVPQPVIFPAVLRPGNAIQHSYFATYPRHPLVPQHIIPVVHPQLRPFFIGRPGLPPTQILIPQHQPQTPNVFVTDQQNYLVPDGSAFTPGVVQPEHPHSHPELHSSQAPYPSADTHPYSQEQHIPVFENNGESPDFQAQFHNQPNFEQQQFEQDQQQLHQQLLEQEHQHQMNQHQFHLQQHQNQINEHQLDQNQFHLQQHQHEINQHQFQQDQFHFQQQQHLEEQYHQQQLEQFGNHLPQEYGPPLQQDYGAPPQQHYGIPQHQERADLNSENQSDESNDTESRHHNHIPSSLQPPLDRPLEDF